MTRDLQSYAGLRVGCRILANLPPHGDAELVRVVAIAKVNDLVYLDVEDEDQVRCRIRLDAVVRRAT